MSMRTERALNVATLLVLSIAVYLALPTVKRMLFGFQSEPLRDTSLDGEAVDSLIVVDSGGLTTHGVPLIGTPHLLYLFSTTCSYCRAQQKQIAGLLATVDDGTVLTASAEPSETTARYWNNISADLSPPLVLSDTSLRILKGYSVPRLYFMRADGHVGRAFIGTIPSWTSEHFRAIWRDAIATN